MPKPSTNAQAPTRKAHLPRRDDLPTIKSAALRKAGVITAAMTSAVIELAGVKREVALCLRHWPGGGSWSWFICPTCSRRCNTLRLYDGRFVCGRCDGLLSHSQMHNRAPALERLRARLEPKPGEKNHRVTRRLRLRLRRVLIADRRARLYGDRP
jgi:hypothetical protein